MKITRPGLRLLAPLWAALLVGVSCTPSPEPPPEAASKVRTREFVSRDFDLDRVYHSMQGPVDQQWVTVGDPADPHLVWVTGVEVETLPSPDDGPAIDDGQQFICHVNVSHPSPEEWEVAYRKRQAEGRSLPFNFFTLIQGAYDLDFPDGFGLPLRSDQRLRLMSMAMNQDESTPPFHMRIRTRLEYVDDRDLQKPLTPLNKFAFDVRVSSPDPFGEHAHLGAVGEGCADLDSPKELEEARRAAAAEASAAFEPRLHFAVPPGRHEYRSTTAGALKIPFDTTAHHISAHLHVFGESLELIDKTDGRSLFKSFATSNSGETGVVEMTHFSSEEGIPIRRDHEYEVVATYDNTTDHPIDAMAVVYVYYKDEPPAGDRVAAGTH